MGMMDIRRRILLNNPHLETASGSIASFNTGLTLPLKELQIAIDPVQEGSGDPSPDNIRPITGWTGCRISRTGKNLMGGNDLLAEMARNQFPYTSMEGGFSFKASNVGGKLFIGGIFKENTRYTIIFDGYRSSSTGGLNLRAAYTDGTYTNMSNPGTTRGTDRYLTSEGETVKGIYGQYSAGTTYCYLENMGIYEGVIPVTDIESYKGNEYSITFPNDAGTVYGGTLTIDKDGNGTLVKEYWLSTNDGTEESWYFFDSDGHVERKIGTSVRTSTTIMSNYFKGTAPKASSSLAEGEIAMSQSLAYVNIKPYSSMNITSLTDWKNYLSEHNLQIRFKYINPITYTLTASQIRTLFGTNNLWANTGNVSVKYWKE